MSMHSALYILLSLHHHHHSSSSTTTSQTSYGGKMFESNLRADADVIRCVCVCVCLCLCARENGKILRNFNLYYFEGFRAPIERDWFRIVYTLSVNMCVIPSAGCDGHTITSCYHKHNAHASRKEAVKRNGDMVLSPSLSIFFFASSHLTREYCEIGTAINVCIGEA